MKTIEEEIRGLIRSELLAVFASVKQASGEPVLHRGPGRPKGSKNRPKAEHAPKRHRCGSKMKPSKSNRKP